MGGGRARGGAVTYAIGQPNPKQIQFLRARKRHIAYGGARGGGKSWIVRRKAPLLCLYYPGIKILIVRRTYPELLENHIRPLCEDLHGIAKYNDNDKRMTFSNGSTIKFGYCASERDMNQYQGQEYDVIFLEEACQLEERWIKMFIACNRATNQYPKRMYYTLNPGGVSHAYFKRLFVDKIYKGKENPDDYEFIQALVQDNTALMEAQPDYIHGLEVLPEKLRRAWLEGRWDVYAGQFFEEYVDRESAPGMPGHVIEPFTPDPRWPIWRSYDYGYNKPFACLWWTMDFDGVLYLILEMYGCTGEPDTGVHWSAHKQFDEIARVEHAHPYLKGKTIRGVADPAIFAKTGATGESIAEVAQKHGIIFEPGDNDRLSGWMQCHYRLAFDDNGRAMMYVFDHCKGFRRTIPALQYDDIKVEDVDTKGEDHIADAWRYLCMARPIAPRVREAKAKYNIADDPLELGIKDARRILR